MAFAEEYVYNLRMRKLRTWLYISAILLAVGIGVSVGVVAVHTGNLPEITALEEYTPSATTRLFADDGELIAEFYLENRTPITLDKAPQNLIHAFLSSEDPRFYSHSGIDLIGIARAMLKNIRARRIVQGGSTITQQLAKTLFLEPERSYSRKIKEAILALQIERRYSKNEILTIYLNQVYLGGGAYGVEAAANVYFGKPAAGLDLAECAMIAGMPPAPGKYSPFVNMDNALSRKHHVLRRMVDEGYISTDEMARADKEPLVIKSNRFVSARAPYFVEYIRQRMEEKYGSTTLYRGGLNIYTTLDLKMQDSAEAALTKGLAEITKRHPRKDHEIQGAFLAIEPHTGSIKAMIGGTDFDKSQFNRCTQAYRQPGSVFKPIIYTAAIEKGYQPDDVVLDAPVSYPGAKPGLRWRPSNYDHKFEGPVTLRRAIARSINVVAVRLLDDVGIPKAIDCARRLGIHSELSPYLPLALGASDVTLMDMTAAFSVFDNFGIYTEPTAIERITDREGRVVEEGVAPNRQAISSETAAAMTDLLTGVVQRGTAYQVKSLGRPAAGKTGTTSDFNDAWFIGFLPSMAAGVWVGYDDHKPIGNKETGAMAALPVWLEFMQDYVKEFNVPPEDFPQAPPQLFQNVSGLNLKIKAAAMPEGESTSGEDLEQHDQEQAETKPETPAKPGKAKPGKAR